MSVTYIAAIFISAIAVIAIILWLLSFRKNKEYLARAESAEQERDKLKIELGAQHERERILKEQCDRLTKLQQDVEQKFQGLADSALRKSQAQFLEIANESFSKQKEGAKGELTALLKPVEETFVQFRQKVEAVEKVRSEDRSAMIEQIGQTQKILDDTRNAAGQLTNALSSPKGVGNWGEESLRNVLEMSGASAFCDFVEQEHQGSDSGGSVRPDVVMRMPGGRKLAIDAKISLDAYLRASEEKVDENIRNEHLLAHAKNLRQHVQALARKEYWDKIGDTVDFVVMYIPGDHFWNAALEHDRKLFDEAAGKKVIIVTPATLIALARTVLYGWRQEDMTKNAQAIADTGKTLYERLCTMSEHIANVGKRLGSSVKSYNDMIGSLEHSVLPQARRFEDLGIEASSKSKKEALNLSGIDTTIRQIQSDELLQNNSDLLDPAEDAS